MYNLLKQYNALLEVDSMSPAQRTISLRGVFNRDIQNNKPKIRKQSQWQSQLQ